MTEERYFYTTYYPHRWTSGPNFHTVWPSPEGWREIASLSEAMQIAERKAVGGHKPDRCETSYGIYYNTEEL